MPPGDSTTARRAFRRPRHSITTADLRRTNELLIVSPDDEFYASVLDLPKVRYVYLTPLDATKTSEFFYRLGMILSDEEFCSLPAPVSYL